LDRGHRHKRLAVSAKAGPRRPWYGLGNPHGKAGGPLSAAGNAAHEVVALGVSALCRNEVWPTHVAATAGRSGSVTNRPGGTAGACRDEEPHGARFSTITMPPPGSVLRKTC
jgi:hypothetical protein